ncbi:MAG TPA: response regulator transcription factor [Xanthomonadaceae bacterium]|nr:response regulator transcription factor [Xanthomonadaceae bacterium]
MIRIALADDQALVREGLRALLRDLGIHIAVEAEDGQALVDALERERAGVDVVVSDIRMPRLDGIAALVELRRRGNRTPVILLTTFDDSALLLRAVEAGAQGFLLKDASPEDLREAIEQVAAGHALLQPVSIDPVRGRFAWREEAPPTGTFNEREVAILRLMAGGYSNKEIARSVHLAEGTVKNYVSEILAKLDARDRTRAVLKAITLRII